MGYATVVAGTNITASWANANVRDQVVTPFASTSARDSAITSPVEGMIAPITGTDVITYYNGSAWVCITPQAATVTTTEGTTSTSFTNLATSGPAVTVATGTSALITMSSDFANNTNGDGGKIGIDVSGASTIAAPAGSVISQALVAAVSQQVPLSKTFKLTGLTAGNNTFTMKYSAVTGGTATFFNRAIAVVGLP